MKLRLTDDEFQYTKRQIFIHCIEDSSLYQTKPKIKTSNHKRWIELYEFLSKYNFAEP